MAKFSQHVLGVIVAGATLFGLAVGGCGRNELPSYGGELGGTSFGGTGGTTPMAGRGGTAGFAGSGGAAVCGNGVCQPSETATGCPADCTRCGDKICSGPET